LQNNISLGGVQMKTTFRLLAVLLAVGMVVSFVGFPKKQVIEPEPEPIPEPEPEPEPQPEPYQFDLGTIHFDFDKSDIRAGDAEILKGNYGQLKEAAEQDETPTVTIEGHCDPIGTSEYNMALGQRRAEAAKMYLAKLGVDKARLSTISYGEEQLVTNNVDEYEQNRRCEFKVGD
jgi:peptidoglycan-associated lipoprotein